jgi:hypothetical protein
MTMFFTQNMPGNDDKYRSLQIPHPLMCYLDLQLFNYPFMTTVSVFSSSEPEQVMFSHKNI